MGGWWFLLVPLAAWWLLGALDLVIGSYAANADPLTPERDLRLYQVVTMIWVPVQIAMIFGLIWFVQNVPRYSRHGKRRDFSSRSAS